MDEGNLKEITVLQSLGILLVVIGHSAPTGVVYPDIYSWVHKYIYSFHMPLFMAISGFLFYYHGGIKTSYHRFLIKKAKRLLLPYIVLSSIAFIPKVVLSKFAVRPIDFSLISYIDNLIYPWNNAIGFFWFLPTLFIIFALNPLFGRLNTRSNLWSSFVVIMTILLHLFNPVLNIKFLNLSGVTYYLTYFFIGCIIARYWNFINNLLCYKLLTGLTVLTIIFNISEYNHSLFNFIKAIIGITLSFGICKIYINRHWSFLDFMSGYSYQIYLLSWFPQTFFGILIYKIFGLNFYITAITMSIGGLLIPIFIAYYMKNSNFKYKNVVGM